MENQKISMLIQYENLTVDELLYPKFAYYSRWFMDFAFFISFSMYIFAIYIVIKKSTKAMGLFKYTVICQITANMIIETYMFLLNPIYLFPLPIVFMYTHFSFIKQAWIYPLTLWSLFGIVTCVTAFLLALSYRVYAVNNIRQKAVAITKKIRFRILACFGLFTVFVWATMAVPYALTYRDPVEIQKIFEYNIPALIGIYQILPLSATILLDGSSGFYLNLFLGLTTFWLFFAVILTGSLNFLFFYRMKQIKKAVSKETYSLQNMLHRCLMLQLSTVFIFFVIPISLLATGYMFHFPKENWFSNLVVPISSLHIVADLSCLLYFIKPYRVFVKSIIFGKNERITISLVTSRVSTQFQVQEKNLRSSSV